MKSVIIKLWHVCKTRQHHINMPTLRFTLHVYDLTSCQPPITILPAVAMEDVEKLSSVLTNRKISSLIGQINKLKVMNSRLLLRVPVIQYKTLACVMCIFTVLIINIEFERGSDQLIWMRQQEFPARSDVQKCCRDAVFSKHLPSIITQTTRQSPNINKKVSP